MNYAPCRDKQEYEFFAKLANEMQDQAWSATNEGMRWKYPCVIEFYYENAEHLIMMTRKEVIYCGGTTWKIRYETNPALVKRLLRMTTGRT